MKALFIAATLLSVAGLGRADAHDAHFSAGKPGDPKQPARTITVVMEEDGKKMLFDPPNITVRQDEQIRFVLQNDGTEDHEFVLATVAESRRHAALMKKYPNMEHDDPNAKRLTPFTSDEFLWKFTKRGTFEYACLIPGHREAGMHGTVTVK